MAIRGSSNIPNWIENIDADRVSYPYCNGCGVHGGFNKAYASIQTGIRTNVQSLTSKYPSADLWVTGHSLGGALTTICALDLDQ